MEPIAPKIGRRDASLSVATDRHVWCVNGISFQSNFVLILEMPPIAVFTNSHPSYDCSPVSVSDGGMATPLHKGTS